MTEEKEKTKKFDENVLTFVVFGILILLVLFQTIQIWTIKTQLATLSISGSVAASGASGSQQTSASQTTQGLPTMVGGC